MNEPEFNELVERVFAQIVDLPDAERSAALTEACAGNERLLTRVEKLLAVEARSGGFLEEPTLEDELSASSADAVVGTVIGRYKLLERIGEGGFGIVYMAEQQEPVVRKVALKIIKVGMDTRSVIARFEAERQALALMDHPNIARVLDAGATETGRPYFVMELVRGIPVTQFCDENKLSTEERLKLFCDVCSAVQHAHQKGIIHRDLKPTNVLVTINGDQPLPKVIDFGIAKATQGRLTDKTLFTQFQQFIGTPAYVSPEQAQMSAVDVDTRSDIYSLGVLLYELLTGSTPFNAKELLDSGLDEMCRIIREQEPVRPSTRLQETIRANSSSRLSFPQPSLDSDLDWIILKAMEKDRTRRYETANGLAMDIKRFLNNEPITAVAPSAWYRLRKFARRNKATVAAGTAVAASLVLGLGLAIFAFVRERDARATAEAERQEADEQRQQANENAERARRLQYTADIQLAQQALDDANLGLAMNLLEAHIPSGDETDLTDLRGWEWRYLWSQLRSDALVSNRDSDTPVASISVSPDGALIAVGRMWGTVEILDAHTLKLRHTLQGEWRSGDAANVAFVPNSDLLVVEGPSPTEITLWDVRNWTARRSFSIPASEGYFRQLASSPDGKRLATYSRRGVLRVWSVETNEIEHEIGFSNDRFKLAFSPDGRLLAAGGSQKRILVIDLDQQNEPLEIPLEQGANSLAFSPDGSILAVAGTSQITLLDSTNCEPVVEIPLEQGVNSLAFSPDGSLLVVAGTSRITLLDGTNGEPVGKLDGRADGTMVFRNDGKTLVAKGADQTINVWDLGSRDLTMVLKGSLDAIWGMAAVGDTDQVVTGCHDGSVSLWRLSLPAERTQLTLHPEIWNVATFSGPDGKMVAVKKDGAVVMGDWRHPHRLETLDVLGNDNGWPISWCPEKQILAAFAKNRDRIKIWSPNDGILAVPTHNPNVWPRSKAFINDGALFVELESEDGLAAWDTEKWERADDRIQVWKAIRDDYKENELRRGRMQGFKVSPDERLLAMWTRKGSVVWYDLKDGTLLADERCHRQWGYDFAFSPDGKTAASTSTGQRMVLWQTEPPEIIGTIRGGGYKLAFSPDSERLIAGTWGGGYKIWDVATRRHLLSLDPGGEAGGDFREVGFLPDGNGIYGIKEKKGLEVWHAPSLEEIGPSVFPEE